MLGGKALELLTPTTGIRVDLSRCLHRRFSRTSCRRCANACPSGAIVVEQGPRIDPALCTGCRLCEAACPIGALSGSERAIGVLATALAEHSRPVLGCRAPGVEAHVHTGCLGFLEIEGLLALALFFPAGLTLNLSRCEGCPSAGMLPALTAAVNKLRQLSGDPWAERLRLARTPADLDYREAALSRREFFTFLRRRSTDAASIAAARLQNAPEPADGGRKTLPPRRRLLLRALPLLAPEVRSQLEAQLFPTLTFAPSCTGCTGCAGICPTGALAASADDPPCPVFTPRLCTGCSLCAEFCRKGGIARSSM
jgi:ferredoxin